MSAPTTIPAPAAGAGRDDAVVFIAPPSQRPLLAALADLSSAGLLAPFHWLESVPDPGADRAFRDPLMVGVSEGRTSTIPYSRAVNRYGLATVRLIRHPREGEIYQVRGDKPERWVRQTDFANDEAVGYLADRLAAGGVEDELVAAGAHAGAPVLIGSVDGGVLFTWEPAMTTGIELLGARGTDARMEDRHRRTNAERRAHYHELMDAKEAARQELRDEAAEGIWTDAAGWSDEDGA